MLLVWIQETFITFQDGLVDTYMVILFQLVALPSNLDMKESLNLFKDAILEKKPEVPVYSVTSIVPLRGLVWIKISTFKVAKEQRWQGLFYTVHNHILEIDNFKQLAPLLEFCVWFSAVWERTRHVTRSNLRYLPWNRKSWSNSLTIPWVR